MSKTLDYEFRLGLLAPDTRPGDAVAAEAAAFQLAGSWLKRQLRDFPQTTHVDWVVVTAEQNSQPLADGLKQVLGARIESVAQPSGDVRVDPAQLIVDDCELLAVPWPTRVDRRSPHIVAAVEYALRSGRKVIGIETDAAARLHWLRLGHPSRSRDGQRIKEDRLPAHRPDISRGFVRVSAFNRECQVPEQQLAAEVSAHCKALDALAQAHGISPAITAPICDEIVPLAVKADLTARQYKSRYEWTTSLAHVVAASAVGVVVFQVLMFPSQSWMIILEIVAIAAIMIGVRMAERRFWHDRYMYSRYVAEQLRIATFALIARHDLSAMFQHHAQRRSFFGDADHRISSAVRRVVDRAAQRVQSAHVDRADVRKRAAFLAAGLLQPQERWHRATAERRHDRAQRLKVTTGALLLAAIALAVLHLFHVGKPHSLDEPLATPAVAGGAHEHDGGRGSNDDNHAIIEPHLQPRYLRLDIWIEALAIVVPIIAGALHGIARYHDDERAGRRSEQMSFRLATLVAAGRACDTEDALNQIADEASAVLAAEVYDWMVELSFRPPEVVV